MFGACLRARPPVGGGVTCSATPSVQDTNPEVEAQFRPTDAHGEEFPLEYFEVSFGANWRGLISLDYQYHILPEDITAAVSVIGKFPVEIEGFGETEYNEGLVHGGSWIYRITSIDDLSKIDDPVEGFKIRLVGATWASPPATYSNGILTLPFRIDPYRVQGVGQYTLSMNTDCDFSDRCGVFDYECEDPKYCPPAILEDISDPPQFVQKLHCKG